MDYRSNPNKWSPCSREDYTRYYNTIRRTRPFCLGIRATNKDTTLSSRPDQSTQERITGAKLNKKLYILGTKNYFTHRALICS